MGLDVMMGVSLRYRESAPVLNERFRNSHDRDDVIAEEDLIIGDAPDTWGEIHMAHGAAFEVSTGLSRYYGIGYERGPILKIITQLEWLRAQPEVLNVWYSSDSREEPRLWTQKDSEKLLWHFFKVGHSPASSKGIRRRWKFMRSTSIFYSSRVRCLGHLFQTSRRELLK